MPASYPGAVKTFATRSNGQTIDASHVNDLQDEVNAIESGLLNGTAPVVCSNATVERLVVNQNAQFVNSSFSGSINIGGGSTMFALQSGNSTLSNLSVSSHSTIVGNLTIGQAFIQTGSIDATLSTGDTHNWAPTGIATALVVRMTGNSSGSTLTGIANPTAGRWLHLVNVSANNIVLKHNDAGSSGENRFVLFGTSNVTVGVHQAVSVWYDAASALWRQMTRPN